METAMVRVQRELERIDLLLRREILRLRARYSLSLDEFRGLYTSGEQVDELLRDADPPYDAAAVTAQAEALRHENEAACGQESEWGRIAAEFELLGVEQDLLFLVLAPELDPKYETLYGYLNNDISRKFVTRDLARRLFCERGPGAVDRALSSGSTLLRLGLLSSTTTSQGFVAHPVLAGFVLARDAPPFPPLRRIACGKSTQGGWIDLQAERVADAAPLLARGGALILNGKRGSGRLQAARFLARQADLGLLLLDAKDCRLEAETAGSFAKAVALQARLEHCAVFLRNCECWFEGDSRPNSGTLAFLRALDRVPLCVAWEAGSEWRESIGHRHVFELVFSLPPHSAREAEWDRAVSALGIQAMPEVIRDLARQFAFTPGEIGAAARHASDDLTVESRPVETALFAAARAQSAHALGKLAPRISTRHRWRDLVLPHATEQRVRELAAAIRNRGLVYEEWGVSPGAGTAGLNALFSGASGTGKTMTAGIIAAECGLDLYRIDLAGVVSKYIGETEKNLDRIFTAARCSNAILFFDEADAIFGKRSEVQDAHDRYANIEVAYLLQKLEDHDGVVILASNLPHNIDDAFSRRIQFHIEFPLPAELHRERLWRGMFPSRTPVAADLDFAFLARQFHLTGGQIRTVSVEAAFLAAGDGRRITMPLIVKAVARHFVKQGHMPAAHEFREYFQFATES